MEEFINFQIHNQYSINPKTCKEWVKLKNMKDIKTNIVKELMDKFKVSTGLEGVHPKRYLWTDAFAVCNYIGLYKSTGNERFLEDTVNLIYEVHHVLGRKRQDNIERRWISGLNEKEGEDHPTIGGLRIGKEMNERMPGEPYNEITEWDRDGQYYHYLTKWMHALNNATKTTGESKYVEWSYELAKKAHNAFTYSPYPGNGKRMYWKMSIDLTRPLVPSMGQHDPLDGFVTYTEIQTSLNKAKLDKDLDYEIHDMKDICMTMSLSTPDPLGIGGLLFDATRIAQLITMGGLIRSELLEVVLKSSIVGLKIYSAQNPTNYPADQRLAFRELGLSIGLKGLYIIKNSIQKCPERFSKQIENYLEELKKFNWLVKDIEDSWMDESNRKTFNWKEHKDINTVMLATSLAPEGFLTL